MQGVNVVVRPLDGERQSAQCVHGDGGLRSLFQRQARQRGERAQRRERSSVVAMGIERSLAAGLLRFALHAASSGHGSRRITRSRSRAINRLHYRRQHWSVRMWMARRMPSGTLAPVSLTSLVGRSGADAGCECCRFGARRKQRCDLHGRQCRACFRASGLWCGRLSQVGQTDWFNFPVRGKAHLHRGHRGAGREPGARPTSRPCRCSASGTRLPRRAPRRWAPPRD